MTDKQKEAKMLKSQYILTLEFSTPVQWFERIFCTLLQKIYEEEWRKRIPTNN